jgi:signal transduction histidine kinase
MVTHTRIFPVEWLGLKGDVRNIRHSGRPFFDVDGHFAGYRCVGHDVWAQAQARAVRVRLEDQLRHAQKRETMGRLVGGLAHEFNNVLGSVLGYLDLAIEFENPASEPKIGEYLGESKKAAERAEALVVKLLQYGRHTEAELKLTFPVVLVLESFPQLSSALPSAVTIRLEINDGLPPVSTNAGQFYRVLEYLCYNASDAQSDTREIIVRVDAPVESMFRCASCSLDVRGPYVAFTVSDHGSGISLQTLARMLNHFSRQIMPVMLPGWDWQLLTGSCTTSGDLFWLKANGDKAHRCKCSCRSRNRPSGRRAGRSI